jgi:hypothetical protein
MPKRAAISQILVIAALSLYGCADSTSRDALEIVRIETKCGVKKGTLRLDDKVGFSFDPDLNEEYEKVDCALAEIRTSSLYRHMKYGFVGNEGPAKEEHK